MTAFPMLPPNSSLDGPRPPTDSAWRFAAANIHRMAGLVEPIRIAERCADTALSVILTATRRPDRQDLEMLAWLFAHGGQWVSLELERLNRSQPTTAVTLAAE